MLLSVLPDIDMVFRIVGIDIGHRTFTHSAIMWIVIGAAILFLFPSGTRRQRVTVGIYVMAYLSHILIGDTLVAPINILYPLGDFVVKSSITVGSLYHIVLEGILLVAMAVIIVINGYSSYNSRIRVDRGKDNNKDDYSIFLFRYHCKLDGILYPLLILAIVVSLLHLSYEFEFGFILSRSFGNGNFEVVILILLLHLAAITIITLMWIISRKRLVGLKMSKIKERD
jgi:membrane-bound metal-dependent hydrolase YbcI (DUF457 family)